MSSRAQIALRNLQLRQLESLPIIEDLQAPKEVLGLLLDDFAKFQAVETTTKAVETQAKKDTKAGFSSSQQSNTTALLKQELKRVRQESQEAQEAAERAIDKHYRTISLKLHPDRTGEESRPAFDALTKARTCLKQTHKRRLYLEQMMHVAQISPSLVKQSHEAWITRNLKEERRPSTTTSTKQRDQPLLIKGGVANDVPRKSYVSILNVKKRRIEIEMPVNSEMHYYVEKIHVVATCADYDKDQLLVAVIPKDKIHLSTTVDATMPVCGIWNVEWFATLQINGQVVHTPHSHPARVDLTSEEQKRRKALIQSTDELAKQRAGDVQFALRKMRGPRPDHLEIERRCDLLHQVVARGRSTLNRLLDLLRADGSEESILTGLKPLKEALELAGPAKESLEQQLDLSSKKDLLKSFKHHVAGLLESGEAAAWLRTVEESNLKSLGGETNRLYQILVEGSVAHHLELDASTFEAASGRTDLFTPKQCEALEIKKEEAEKFVEKEAERAMENTKEKRAAEAKERAELAAMKKMAKEKEKKKKLLDERYEAERQAQLAAIRESKEMAGGNVVEHPARSLVEIQGLKSKIGLPLNDTIGTIMHREGERYVVQCQVDGKFRKLLPANLKNLGFSELFSNPANSANSWNCDICTYLHEEDNANALVCRMCNNPRDNRSPSSYSALSELQRTVPAQTKKTATAPVQPKANATVMPTVLVQSKQQAFAPEPKTSKQNLSKHHKTPKEDSSTHPCFHGSSCRFIENGCKFYHSYKEIADAKKKISGDHQLYIPDATVLWVIGKGGSHMKDVQRQSRAKVSIDQKKMYPNNTRCARISGDQKSIDIAVRMVKDLVARYDDLKGGEYIATERPEPAKTRPKAKAPFPPPIKVPAKPSLTANSAVSPVPPPPSIIVPASVSPSPQPIQKPKTTVTSLISPPKSTYLALPAPEALVPVRMSSEKTKLHAAKERDVTPSPPPSGRLFAFLQEHKDCLKGSPAAFSKWLESEDIVNLEDLVAAVSDEDYLHEVLQQGDGKVGVKGFKRAAWKKAVLAAVENKSTNAPASNTEMGFAIDEEPPAELVCPISHSLMLNNPVIAADGHTYEMAAIDAWFRKQQAEIAAAKQHISGGHDSQQARAIIERGVLSPMTHSKMPHLSLTPNHNVRNLARAFAKNGSW